MAVSEGELLELAQNGTVICRDGRTTGAKNWITNGLTKREMIDSAEVQTLQDLFGLPGDYPSTALPVVSWTILDRIPTVT